METIKQPVLVFYSYDENDRKFRDQLDKHLTTLKRLQLITGWHDRDIPAGTEWKSVVNEHLNAAQIILLLISSDFIASDYRYSIEMTRALERHNSGDAFVLPVLLRSCDIDGLPFDQLDFLPENMKAITLWADTDEAFQEVAKGIRKVVEELIPRNSEQWLEEGIRYRRAKHFEKALVACERALRLDHNYAHAHRNKGDTLYELERYAKALDSYRLALHLNPISARIYCNIAIVLWYLGQYDESLDAYDCALQLESTSQLWSEKGNIFLHLERNEEALQAYEQAVRLKLTSGYAYNNKGIALLRLKRYQEAMAAYEQAIQLQPTSTTFYNNKGRALFYLGRYEEARDAYEDALRLDPHLATAYTNLAETLEKLDQAQEAALARAKADMLRNFK